MEIRLLANRPSNSLLINIINDMRGIRVSSCWKRERNTSCETSTYRKISRGSRYRMSSARLFPGGPGGWLIRNRNYYRTVRRFRKWQRDSQMRNFWNQNLSLATFSVNFCDSVWIWGFLQVLFANGTPPRRKRIWQFSSKFRLDLVLRSIYIARMFLLIN